MGEAGSLRQGCLIRQLEAQARPPKGRVLCISVPQQLILSRLAYCVSRITVQSSAGLPPNPPVGVRPALNFVTIPYLCDHSVTTR
jgi:hypothetical protein